MRNRFLSILAVLLIIVLALTLFSCDSKKKQESDYDWITHDPVAARENVALPEKEEKEVNQSGTRIVLPTIRY